MNRTNTEKKRSTAQIVFGGIVAATAWFAVLFQLYLTAGSIANFLSYFTVLCNLLVAVSLTVLVLMPSAKAGRFFSTLSVQTAIALYIFIVGLVYNLVLRGIWAPAGWQLVVDNLLHVVVPLLYVLYWALFRAKGSLQWRDGLYWLLFPLAYLLYSLIRGPLVQWYPYPFLDVAKLGYEKVLINILLMLALFLAAGLALIAANRLVRSNKTT